MSDPIISSSDERTRQWLAMAVGVVLAVGVAGVAFFLIGSGDDDGGGGFGDDGGTEVQTGETTTTERIGTPAPPTVAPPELPPIQLLVSDSRPAVDGLNAAVGQPFLTRELVLYADYAILEYQDPAVPTHIDRVTWRQGDVDDPAPVMLPSGFGPDVEAELFDLGGVRIDLVPSLVQLALEQFALENETATHVIIDRFLPFDGNVNMRVYVSDPVRGGGGYVRFGTDGSFIEVVS